MISPVTAPERLTPEDERILHLESETVAGHTCKVVIFRCPPGTDVVDALRQRIGERLVRVPRCRQRIVATETHGGARCWSDDDGFAVARHVRPAQTDGVPVTWPRLLELVARLMEGRLDRAQPLWTIDVVDALDDGRAALVWRIHHCMADGTTGMQWASELLWDDAGDGTPGPAPATAGAPGAGRFSRALRTAKRTPSTLARELRPTAESSPFSGTVGTARDVAFTRCSLDEMHTVGHSLGPGATVNDVLLAVVAGGIREWLISRGAPLHAIRLKVPVSMHALAGADAANRDSFLFVDVPLDDPDPVARLRAVHRATQTRKQRHDAPTLYSVLDSLGRVAPLGHAATRWAMSPHVFAVNVSNVPGPRSAPALLGGAVEALYTLAEVAQHHALRVSAVSLGRSMFVGLNADPRAVPGLDTLASGIEAAMADLARAERD
jgi:diacylglycerol O-acyltransferase